MKLKQNIFVDAVAMATFKKRYRNPATNCLHGRTADNASTASERSIVKETDLTGESNLYRLYDLCGFDPVRDQVIDVMHCLCLPKMS